MIILASQPTLGQLNDFIGKISAYPLSIQRLLKLANDIGEPTEVINFYQIFPRDQVFDNQDDLAGRSEQIQIMHQEEMPKEHELATEEF
jgi:hypothetical protein